jgi:DNA-binding XRE family transcriptional regulator
VSDTKNWREIERKIPVDDQQSALYERVVAADVRLGTLDLGALRRRRGVSQAVVADALDVSQPNISRIEQQQDVRLSTLGHYVAALGGRLDVRAVFGDETVELLHEPAPPRGG